MFDEGLRMKTGFSSMSYVLTDSLGRAGAHSEKRKSYGHSIVIDPWGKVIAELGHENKDGPEVIFAEIDFDRLKQIRKGMPLLRRT